MPSGSRRLRIPPGSRLLAAARVSLAVAAALLLTWPGQVVARTVVTEQAPLPAMWSMNLYDSTVFRYQNPDLNGCAAGSTVTMLNLIALSPQSDQPPPRGSSVATDSFRWTISISWDAQKTIMWYERSHMSMTRDLKGSDPEGWRNGLNYFGWGSIYADVYRDTAYTSFSEAAHAVVDSIARTNKPAGVLGWAGSHAQYITGYMVQGDDPRISDNYNIIGVYLSDPLREEARPTVFLSLQDWKSGPYVLKFAKYEEIGSILVDPIDGQIGDNKWHGKWVVIEPVR